MIKHITKTLSLSFLSKPQKIILSLVTASLLLGGCGGGGGGTTPTTPITNQAPVFTSASSATVAENQTSAITLTATDSDNDTLTYSISGTDASSFTINATTGVVTFNTAPDFETKSSYSFVATVNDGTTTTNQNVTITISDVDETLPDTSSPTFTSNTSFSVNENQTSGFTAVATDNSIVTYSLSGTNASSFTINATTGVVTFNTSPDYETKNSYSLIVTATDSSNNASSQNVTITISDVNETIPDTSNPVFTSASTFSVAENQTSGFTATATDSSAITYSISGTDANSFTINQTSGVVTFKVAPNYETKTSYTLTVTATDSSNNTSTQNVTVNISDVDESSSGYLIDSAVEGVDYICGNLTGVTNSDGRFTYETSKCPTGVEFKLGSLSLGTIDPLDINTTDKYLTIQELAGVTRDNITDGNVTKLAVLLQSLDDDNNATNGIYVTQTIKNAITLTGNIKDRNDSEISTEITARGKTEKDVNDALAHLLSTLTSKSITTTSNINPTDFTIANKTGMALGSEAISDTITIAGLTIPTYITIKDGEYSLDGGTTWKSTKSLVSNGQTVKVRHTTANSLSGTTTTTLKIGGVTKTFGSTTLATLPVFQSGDTWKGKVYNTITSSTGKVWLDRNLGATQVCTALDDTACYGDYYQWGRDADDHQVSNSATSSTLATDLNTTGNSFILNNSDPRDWTTLDSDGAIRSANWSKTDGSSVCPVGYRVPTEAELTAETISNSADAYTKLKLPSAGGRGNGSGSLYNQGSWGYIWSSSPNGSYYSKSLYFDSSNADWLYDYRAGGHSVRCLRD